MMERTVIIVAGGKGSRMGSSLPKQFLLVDEVPVLMRTMKVFREAYSNIAIIVVLPHDQQAYWQLLCEQYHFEVSHQVVDGGATRFHSVCNGLAVASSDGLIAVHDGVRPFVSTDVIHACFEDAVRYRAVVPVVDMVESLRHVDGKKSEAVLRDEYKVVQTPQVFEATLLHDAYRQEYSDSFTDDASVVEYAGVDIHLTPGNRENIKLTTPFDMMIANAWVKCRI